MSKSCRNCGLLTKDCTCYKKKDDSIPKSTNCKTCNVIHDNRYLILGDCHNCFTVSQIEPAEREYYRVLAQQFGLKLVDIPNHVKVANIKNIPIEYYLQSLPKSREAFKQYFAGRDVQIGGVSV